MSTEYTPYQFESTIPYTDQNGARHSVALMQDGRLVNVTESTGVYGFRPNDIGGYTVLGGNGNSAANYPDSGSRWADAAYYPAASTPIKWVYGTLEETTPLVCAYCGGTFGADDVRCRGCGADVREAGV